VREAGGPTSEEQLRIYYAWVALPLDFFNSQKCRHPDDYSPSERAAIVRYHVVVAEVMAAVEARLRRRENPDVSC
jgi:hypothetical protein